MELRQLRYFIILAEELHFAHAAERLHIAQQPLSFQIKQLEQELGVQLFHRTTRYVALTDAGHTLLKEVRIALDHLQRGVEEAQRVERGETGRLVIGYITTTLYNILPATVRRFRERFPDVELVLQELVPSALGQQLIAGEIDAGLLIREDFEDSFSELEWKVIYSETISVVLPRDHPLSTHTSIPLRALADERFVIYARHQKQHTYDLVISYCRQAGFSPGIVQEAASEQAIIGLVAAGLGISLVVGTLGDMQAGDVVYRPLIEPTVSVDFVVAWKRDRLSPQVQALLEIAHNVAGEISSI